MEIIHYLHFEAKRFIHINLGLTKIGKVFEINLKLQVHERGGSKDKIHYNVTLLLGLAVAAELLEFTYRGIFGKK